MTKKEELLEFVRLFSELNKYYPRRFEEMFNGFIKDEYPEEYYLGGIRFSTEECSSILYQMKVKIEQEDSNHDAD